MIYRCDLATCFSEWRDSSRYGLVTNLTNAVNTYPAKNVLPGGTLSVIARDAFVYQHDVAVCQSKYDELSLAYQT
jgi:hypothetical protein